MASNNDAYNALLLAKPVLDHYATCLNLPFAVGHDAEWNAQVAAAARTVTDAVEGYTHSASGVTSIDRKQLESFCWEVKVKFRNEPTYDKADLLADIEGFLQARGVEVSDGSN